MAAITAIIRRMTFEEAHQLKLQNRGLILDHQGVSYHLNAGTSDKIHVFTRSVCTYVLTINKALGYIGLDAHMPKEPDPINSIFLHSENQFIEILGRRWKSLSPSTITIRLMDYLI